MHDMVPVTWDLSFLIFFSLGGSFVLKDLLHMFYFSKLPIYLLYSYLNLVDNQWPSELNRKHMFYYSFQ